jgi:hypothetical protein
MNSSSKPPSPSASRGGAGDDKAASPARPEEAINPDRRRLAQAMAASIGLPWLTACGGGDGAAETSAAGAETSHALAAAPSPAGPGGPPVPNPTPTPAPAPAPTPPGSFTSVGTMRFSMQSTVAALQVPFSIGFAFRQGDIPAGSTVASDRGALQVTPRNRWPDGSLKFAQLAGKMNLLGNSPVSATLRASASGPVGGALTLANLAGTGITAEVGCGAFGSAAWSQAAWMQPFMQWVSGPLMSSWIYRRPVGTDPHLVAWLEVRLYAGGIVEVLPWVENGYVNVPGPVNKQANYVFSLNGQQRFAANIDLKHHQRTPLLSGGALSHWVGHPLGGTPSVPALQHDALYMMATELVPAYHRAPSKLAGLLAGLPSGFTPLAPGSFTYSDDSMPSPGFQEPIGLLPQHEALYLTADSTLTSAAVVRGGYSAGRYGTHYRDENTQQPILPANYPHTCLRSGQGFYASGGSTYGIYLPAATGGSPPTWDMAHCPSVGYLAYLVTGAWYFMEEAQFAALFNYLGVSDLAVQRDGARGLVQADAGSVGTRDSAWAWRTLVQALCVTPDDSAALRPALQAVVQNNIDHFHARYVAQANNPLGYTQAGTAAYDGTLSTLAPWQQDFLTAAWGWSVSLALPISAGHQTRLREFFAWTAQSIIHRLGAPGAGGWAYQNAATYTAKVSGVVMPDWNQGTGPWYSAAQAYAATYTPPPAWLGDTTQNVLAGEDLPASPSYAARSFWGNLQPAIAYAVRHGVPGAAEAYGRMTGASNWPALKDALESRPVWAVKPSQVPSVPVAQPTWLAGKALNTWFEIPGTAGSGGAAVDAFSGFAFSPERSEIFIAAAGGHFNSSDNRVVSIELAVNTPNWVLRQAPSSAVQQDVAYYSDGKPSARHLYQTTHWVPALGRVMLMGARFVYGTAVQFPTVDGFNPATNTWDAQGTWANVPSGASYGSVVDGQGNVWTNLHWRWNPQTRAWSTPITNVGAPFVRWPYAFDSVRNQLFGLCYADGEGYGPAALNAVRVPVGGNASIQVTFNPSAALTQFMADAPAYCGMDHDPVNDRFLFYCGQGAGAGRVYVVTPNGGNVWDMAVLPLGAGSLIPPAPGVGGVNNRFRYVPALKGFVLLAHGASNLFFLKTS